VGACIAGCMHPEVPVVRDPCMKGCLRTLRLCSLPSCLVPPLLISWHQIDAGPQIGTCYTPCQLQSATLTLCASSAEVSVMDSLQTDGGPFSFGDSMACMLDLDARTISFARNGTPLGTAYTLPGAPGSEAAQPRVGGATPAHRSSPVALLRMHVCSRVGLSSRTCS